LSWESHGSHKQIVWEVAEFQYVTAGGSHTYLWALNGWRHYSRSSVCEVGGSGEGNEEEWYVLESGSM
jgi:hypothetical protein